MSYPRAVGIAVALAWAGALVAGATGLLARHAAPGTIGGPPAGWPAGSALRPEPGRFTVLLFAHPYCPCTRASAGELGWVLDRAPAPTDAVLVVVRPPGAPIGWGTRTGLTAALPTALVVVDDGGREAGAFGAETSGTVVLYDPAGRPVFRGGVTAGRGHAGDNPARRALLALLRGDPAAAAAFPVFGCPLIERDNP